MINVNSVSISDGVNLERGPGGNSIEEDGAYPCDDPYGLDPEEDIDDRLDNLSGIAHSAGLALVDTPVREGEYVWRFDS